MKKLGSARANSVSIGQVPKKLEPVISHRLQPKEMTYKDLLLQKNHLLRHVEVRGHHLVEVHT